MIDSLSRVSYELAELYPDSAENLALRGLEYAREGDLKYKEVLLLINLGYIKLVKGDHEASLRRQMEALNIAEKTRDTALMARAYSHLSYLYTDLEIHYKAEKLLQKSIDLLLSSGDTLNAAVNLYNLALLHSEENEYRKAVKYLKSSLGQVKRDDLSPIEIGQTYDEIGFNYIKMEEYDSATHYLQLSDSIYSSLNNYTPGSLHYYYRGMLDNALNRLDSAEVLLDKAEQRAQETQNYRALINILLLKTELYDRNARFKKAVNAGLNAYKYAEEEQSDHYLIKAAMKLGHLFNVIGDRDNALQYMKIAAETSSFKYENDKIKLNLISDLEMLQRQNDILENEKELIHRAKQLEHERLEMRERQIWLIGGLGAGSFLIVLFVYSAYRRNKRLLDEKKHILSVVGHDIRSPLAQLENMLQLLDDKSLDDKSRDYLLEGIKENLSRSYQTVDEILGWAKNEIEKENSNCDCARVLNVAEKAIKYNQSEIERKKLRTELKIDEGHIAKVNPDHLEIILRNLISNAVKFSPEESPINISSSIVKDRISIDVTDFGEGIPPEKQKALFKSPIPTNNGNKGNNENNGNKGAGIGLFLSHRFVKANKGKITLKSTPGKGTSFTLKFLKAEPEK